MFLKEKKWRSSENFLQRELFLKENNCFKENNYFSRKISGKVQKTFAAKRIIVSQGEEVEKFRKFFAAKRIIVSQVEKKLQREQIFKEKISGKVFRCKENNCFSRKKKWKSSENFLLQRE